MPDATDQQLRVAADQARGMESRASGYFFNQQAYTAALRAVYNLGRQHEKEENNKK